MAKFSNLPWRALASPFIVIGFFGSASASNYSSEAQALAEEIVFAHPDGKQIAENNAFIEARNALLKIAGSTDYPHYAIALGRMFHAVDDGHTASIPAYGDNPAFRSRYPIRLRRFDDGLYVVAAREEGLSLLGVRLTEVAGRSVAQIVRKFVETSSGGNRAWPANFSPFPLLMPGWLIGFDIIENDLSKPVLFKGIAPDGRHVSARLIARINGQMSLTPLARKISMVDKAADGMTNYIAMGDNARSAILRIGTMEDEKPKSFSEFTSEVSQILPQESVRRLIIDLRDNGGGDNMLAEPLRRILIKSRFNRPGGIYVLISPGTFSAAMNFATRLERETDAIFVGEPTGSSPNHYGDAVLKKAPLSGTPYLISTERWQDSSPFDHREWILPDLPALPTFDDYVNGRDAALNKALTDEPGPMSEADWRLRVMRPWERNSQKVKWTLFYE